MRDYLDKRCLEEAEYIIKTGATVRKTAKEFGLSKSTVHKDVTERLYSIDKSLYKRVKKVLQKNLNERHVRGGEATRQKYLNMIKCKNKK
ncbi:MAG: sporulation transcriptional regulator SpoIIID [Clostridia bacterium]|nr:sporulation transcriptional regulator SpoIIID [Clostridia bacterium]